MSSPFPSVSEAYPILLGGENDVAVSAAKYAGSVARRDRILNAIGALGDAVVTGSIANPVYKEAKDVLGRAVEDAWERHVARPHLYGKAGEPNLAPVFEVSWSIGTSSLHEVLAAARKLDKVKIDHPAIGAMRAWVAEILPLAQAAADLKGKVVKREIKTAEEKEAEGRFVPPPPREKAAFAVYAALELVVARSFVRLRDTLSTRYVADLGAFIDRQDAGEPNRFLGYPVSRLVEMDRSSPASLPGSRRMVPIKDAERVAATLALQDAKLIRDQFIAKNLKKIAAVIEAKGVDHLDGIHVLGESVSLEGLAGVFRVAFRDGSGFTVKNAVVRSTSIHGVLFLRWPLTFHNVVLGDGVKMGAPSEERMHSVFPKGIELGAEVGMGADDGGEDSASAAPEMF